MFLPFVLLPRLSVEKSDCAAAGVGPTKPTPPAGRPHYWRVTVFHRRSIRNASSAMRRLWDAV